MAVEHRPSKKHQNADALSRIPDGEFLCENYRLGTDPESLPCGGCSYCMKVHKNWAKFTDTVDDVIQLAQRNKVSEVTLTPRDDEDFLITHLDIGHMDGPFSVKVNGVTVGNTDPRPNVDLTSMEVLRKEQESDDQLTPLRQWLLSKEEPDEGIMMMRR